MLFRAFTLLALVLSASLSDAALVTVDEYAVGAFIETAEDVDLLATASFDGVDRSIDVGSSGYQSSLSWNFSESGPVAVLNWGLLDGIPESSGDVHANSAWRLVFTPTVDLMYEITGLYSWTDPAFDTGVIFEIGLFEHVPFTPLFRSHQTDVTDSSGTFTLSGLDGINPELEGNPVGILRAGTTYQINKSPFGLSNQSVDGVGPATAEGNVTLRLQDLSTVVPEPGSLTLLLSALVPLAAFKRRR